MDPAVLNREYVGCYRVTAEEVQRRALAGIQACFELELPGQWPVALANLMDASRIDRPYTESELDVRLGQKNIDHGPLKAFLRPEQLPHWDTVLWMMDPTDRVRGQGRTFMMALAIVKHASDNIGVKCAMFDHFTQKHHNGNSPLHWAVKRLLDQLQDPNNPHSAWRDMKFELRTDSLTRVS